MRPRTVGGRLLVPSYWAGTHPPPPEGSPRQPAVNATLPPATCKKARRLNPFFVLFCSRLCSALCCSFTITLRYYTAWHYTQFGVNVHTRKKKVSMFLSPCGPFLTEAGMERSAMTDSTERFRHCALLHSGFCWEMSGKISNLSTDCESLRLQTARNCNFLQRVV